MVDRLLTYKGYHTFPQYDVEECMTYGKIDGISDLVQYECFGTDQNDIINAFHEAVDDYLNFLADMTSGETHE